MVVSEVRRADVELVVVAAAAAQRGGFGGSQRQQQPRSRETPSAQQLREWYAGRGRSGGVGPCTYVLRNGGHHGETCGLPHTAQRCFGRLTDAWRAQFPDAVELPRWHDLLRQNVAIFDLDFNAILAAMSGGVGPCTYVLRTGGHHGETCGLPHTAQRCFGRLTDAWRAQFPDAVELPRWHDLLRQNVAIFDLDFNAILAAMYALTDSVEGDCYLSVPPDPGIEAAALGASASAAPGTGESAAPGAGESALSVALADPSGGPLLAHSSTVLPCPAAPSGLLSGLHLPSFSMSLVSGADLQDAWVVASSQVFAAASRSSPASAPCSCRPLSHETLLWHHRLGHPSLPRLRGIASRTLVSGLPRSLPPLPPGPAPTCVPCVKGRQRAAPHSSTLPPTEAPLQTLHMDVWGPARVCGQGHERYFLLVVDDYSRYTTVFPLRSKGEVPKGIRQTLTLPASPQQNGIAERRIGMVMDVNRTSMIHAAAPHFLWPFAVQYAAHQIKLQPRVSLPETTPTLRWMGKVGDASAFRVWGSRAFVRDTSADKLSCSAIPCVFLGFPPDAPGWQFYHPTSRRVLSSQDVTFDESVSYYRLLPRGTASGGAEPRGTASGGAEPARAESEGSPWYARRCRRATSTAGAGAAGGAAGAGAVGGAAGAGAAGGSAGAGAAGGAAGAGAAGGAAGPGGARTGGTGAAGAGGAAGVGAAGTGAGGAAGVVTRDPGAEVTGAVSAVSGGVARPRPYYVPLLQQVLGLPPSPGPTPPLLSPPPVQSQSQLQPASPIPGPSPYSGPTRGLTERREPESHPVSRESRSESPVCTVCAGRRVSRPRPPPVRGTHSMALRPSTAPQRVPLPSPPASSLPDGPNPESDSLHATSPTVTRFLTTAVTDPLFESSAASALVAELVDFTAACRSDYATSLVAESASMSICPPSVGDPDAPDILTPRSYAEAIDGPYSSQWQAAMDAEMASWKSTGTYVDEIPPPGANIVSGMWIFRVKRPPGSPPVFKARYVARGFRQRKGVDFFQTFSPTPKMTTLRVLLHVAAQRDYELHSLDFSTPFLQGSLHEEIWLRRPPGFTGSFPADTQWSLRRPVYGLRQAPREWHNILRTTLAALGFTPPTADPSLFLRTNTTLALFYVLVYVDDLVFATADTEALAHVKSELQKRHTCTDLGELTSYLGLLITRDKAQRTITLTKSPMVQQVLQRFGFTYSSPQSTPLPTGHSLSAPPSDESVEPSGPYPELVGCLITSGMGLVLGGRARVVLTGHADASWVDDLATQRSSQGYTISLGSGSVSWRSTRSSSVLSSSCEAEIYAGAMAAQELRWLTYLLTDLGEPPRSPPVQYGDNKAMLDLCQEHRLEHRTKHISLRYFLGRELQQHGQLRLAYVASQANTADVFTKAFQPCDHQRFCVVLGLVPTVPHLLTS
ncbi:unnamed protein product [Closterium sp. NIES-54]